MKIIGRWGISDHALQEDWSIGGRRMMVILFLIFFTRKIYMHACYVSAKPPQTILGLFSIWVGYLISVSNPFLELNNEIYTLATLEGEK